MSPYHDWGKLIGDLPSATAILDRFLQHAELIQITGKSYRLRNREGANPDGSTPKCIKKGKADQSDHRIESNRSAEYDSPEKEEQDTAKSKSLGNASA